MKIALIGYGKMGTAIEEIALEKGHSVVLKINSKNIDELTESNLQVADVAIEFSGPSAAFRNISFCLEAGKPIVSGSTGWLDGWDDIKQLCEKKKGTFLYASNFSIGVNIFFELNKKLASLMSSHSEYNASLEEIHHTGKKDSPSGTAITLAEQILKANPGIKKWINQSSLNKEELGIESKRIDPAPGTHRVKYSSAVDTIEIIHTAHNRQGFAYGAVLAAEFIKGKSGLLSMKDVLDLGSSI